MFRGNWEGDGLYTFDETNWTKINTSSSGLTDNYINCITIDQSGNKWIGTHWGSGLAKFDGTNWTVYDTTNSGLPDDIVRCIAIDSSGNKWIGAGGGVAKFDGNNWTNYSTHNSGLPHNDVTYIAKLAGTGQAKPDEGERNGPLSIAVAAVKRVDPTGLDGQTGRDARVVVTGDSDFAANGGLDFAGHLNFVLDSIAWLSEQEELIAIRPSSKTDSPIVLTALQQRTVTWVTTLMTFQAVVAVGLVVYVLRRRHQ